MAKLLKTITSKSSGNSGSVWSWISWLCFLLLCAQKLQVFQEVNFSCLEGSICHCLGVHESETHQWLRMKSVFGFPHLCSWQTGLLWAVKTQLCCHKSRDTRITKDRVTKGRRGQTIQSWGAFERFERFSFNISAPGLIALMLFLTLTSQCKPLNKTPKMQTKTL